MENENNKNQKPDNLKNAILEKIKSGNVKMKPRAYFILQVVLLVIVASLVLASSSIIASYIIFGIRASGHQFLLGFGLRGIWIFFLTFPWLILALDIALVVVFDRLVKQFKFGYRSPLVYLLAATLFLTVGAAFLINMTSFHRQLLLRAEKRQLPVVGNFYENLRRSARDVGVFRGVVVSVSGNSFILKRSDNDKDESADQWKVVAPDGVEMDSILKPGDNVFVAGIINGNEIRAYGIRKLLSDE